MDRRLIRMKCFFKKIIVLCSIVVTLISWQQELASRVCHISTQAKEFYFIRHGQTDHNIGLVTGWVDLPLNQCGQQQATAIKALISSLPIKTVCYSPLLRTRQTKDIIVSQLLVLEHEIADLMECSLENCRHLPILQTEGFVDVPISLQLFIDQVKNGIETSLLKTDHPVLIVAHYGVYYVLCYLLGIAVDDCWKIGNCVPVHFYLDGDGRWIARKLI